MHQHDLDWPEAIFEALLQLEQVHGDVDTFLATIKAVDTEQLKLARRRERQQEVYYEAAEPVTAEVVEAPKVPEAPVENQGARCACSGIQLRSGIASILPSLSAACRKG